MITFSEKNCTIYITADGHVTAQYCADIKNKVFERLEAAPEVKAIHVELKNCTYMDSTFIGMIAGFNKRLKKLNGSRLHVQNAGDECTKLFTGMGLTQLLDFTSPAVTFPEEAENCADTPISAKDMLDAHENLMEISEENREKFKTLHQVLSAGLDK